MRKNIKGVNINYEFYDNESKINLVYLHGWGQNIQMMMPIAKPFIKKYNVLIIDLPGFGDSAEPNEVWSIEDYSDMVYELTKELKMNNPILIGHSFGGKISLSFATKYKTKKLVLLACPYRVENKKLTTKQKIFKVLKKVPGLNKLESTIKKYVGSTDYRNASEMMRKILVKHVNYDLTDKLKYIKCLATNISAADCTTNSVYRVASGGTFVKDSSMNDWATGSNGIPSGWTVQNAA